MYGSEIRFWEDSWLGMLPLRDQYPTLYNISCNENDSIAEIVLQQVLETPPTHRDKGIDNRARQLSTPKAH
jgi:hypothetical protein